MSHTRILQKTILFDLYVDQNKSVHFIAQQFKCSENKVNYWLNLYGIPKRTISEAIYVKNNQFGDPFHFRLPNSPEEERLFGMGLGLYWGEGNKANKNAIRIGNSDSGLLLSFMDFLSVFFAIEKEYLRFHLHLYSDMDTLKTIDHWVKELGISKEQFYKPFISPSKALGTYKSKSQYGVVTLYYQNAKARNILINQLQIIGAYGSMKRLPL